MNFSKRTHNCGELSKEIIGNTVSLNGWVSKKRDLGGILFLDLRDRYGITQIKISPEKKNLIDIASKLGNEYVISVTGKVVLRENQNLKIATGEIEVDADILQILNESDITPFVVEEDVKANEDLRLQYRYLDLRRRKMMDNLLVRNEVYSIVRNYFYRNKFVEIETPILMKSTPEGARDYLVPSRVHKGKFYALPQSPQTYKQILMVAGLDKYIQICKCFRDEDLRADRQPEFTQIDLEMSFVKQEEIFEVSEGLFREIWKNILNFDLENPFPIMKYDDAIANYGSDKPDMRLGDIMLIKNLTNLFNNSEFKVFQNATTNNLSIAGIKINKSTFNKRIEITRKISDNYSEYFKKLGLGGLIFLKNDENILSSSILKFLSQNEIENLKNVFGLQKDDYIFIATGERKKLLNALGQLRLMIAEDYELLDDSLHKFLWITDFPLFQHDEETSRFVGEHHVFTSPKDEFVNNLDSDDKEKILDIRANCYDLVYNGNEIGSGSIRIHNSEMQKKVFKLIGLNEEEANSKFGFILEAFKYGAPPHGGVAFGLDRTVAMLCQTKSIRDVIAFPKTVSAASLMDNSPSVVVKNQLDELGIKLNISD